MHEGQRNEKENMIYNMIYIHIFKVFKSFEEDNAINNLSLDSLRKSLSVGKWHVKENEGHKQEKRKPRHPGVANG